LTHAQLAGGGGDRARKHPTGSRSEAVGLIIIDLEALRVKSSGYTGGDGRSIVLCKHVRC